LGSQLQKRISAFVLGKKGKPFAVFYGSMFVFFCSIKLQPKPTADKAMLGSAGLV